MPREGSLLTDSFEWFCFPYIVSAAYTLKTQILVTVLIEVRIYNLQSFITPSI